MDRARPARRISHNWWARCHPRYASRPPIPKHSHSMPNPIRFVLVLHNHQPIGNFEHVFEQAYQDSYRPFLDVFSRYPVAEDLPAHQRLADGMARRPAPRISRPAGRAGRRGRIEIIGGAVLRADPGDDPLAATASARSAATPAGSKTACGATVRGMWMPERVWEQSLHPRPGRRRHRVHRARRLPLQERRPDRVAAHGYYLTEDDGRLLSIFPGSERLRYTDSLRRAAGDDRLPGRHRRASSPTRWWSSATTARSSAPGRKPRSTSTPTAGWSGSSTLLVANQELDPGHHAGRGGRQRAARWARSICPTAATAR